jgi:hypothetical protein
MRIPRVVTNRNLPCRMMVHTRASEATSSSTARQRQCRAPLQEARDPESKPKIAMDVNTKSDDTAEGRPVPGEPIHEGSTTMDRDDDDLVYDHTCFQRDKVRCRYTHYYHGRRIIIERGATIKEFDERVPRVRVVLDAQGWTSMAEDHHLAIEAVLWEFYANLHQTRGNSFRTWLRWREIEVTPTLISKIAGAPRVRDPVYPYLVDHLPTRVDLVACFTKGHPHQMELEGEGSFQMSDFSNDIRCIYHILVSRVLPVISHTMITIERARCLYAMLTEAPINYSSVVTTTTMYVRLLDKGFALPYGALITWITEHARVDMTGLREIQP